MSKKQFRSRFILLGILLIAAFCLWISTLVNGNKTLNIFLSMLPLIALVVALRITKEKYDKSGYFSAWQAAAFFKACRAAGIMRIDAAGESGWKQTYQATVGSLPFDNVRENVKHAKHVFAVGKEITERKEKSK